MALSAEAQAEFDQRRESFARLKALAEQQDNPTNRDLYLQQAQAAKEAAIKIQETGQVFGGSDALRFAAQGAFFGFGDEMEAGIRAPFSDQNYGEIRDNIRADLNATRDAYPAESYGFELAGGLAVPGSILGNSARAASTLPLMARNLAMTGGALGGVAGAGYSEAEGPVGFGLDVGQGAALGAVATPVLGIGVPAVLEIGKRVLAKLAQPLDMRADQLIGQIMRRTGWTADTVMTRLGELGPDATLADLDNALLAWTSVAVERSDEAANMLPQYLNRNATAKDRLISVAEDATQTQRGDYQRVAADLTGQRQQTAAREYGLVRDELIPRTAVDDILNTTRGGEAYNISMTAWQDRNRTQEVPEDLIPLGILDATQRMLGREGQRVAAGQRSDTADIFGALQGDLRDRLDTVVPPYATARGSFATTSGILDAGETGRSMRPNVTGERMDELEALVPGMTTPERMQFNRGWLENFIDQVERGGGSRGTGYAGSRLGTPEVRQRQFDLVEAPGRVGRLERQMLTEDTYNDTASFLLPQVNSRTSVRAAARERADAMAGIGGALTEVMPSDLATVVNIVKNTAGVSEPVATALGQRLMNPNITRTDIERMLASGEVTWDLLSKIKDAGFLLPATGAASQSAVGVLSGG